MGEARRRGTLEQRKAEGEIKEAKRKVDHDNKMLDLRRRRGKTVMPYVLASILAM